MCQWCSVQYGLQLGPRSPSSSFTARRSVWTSGGEGIVPTRERAGRENGRRTGAQAHGAGSSKDLLAGPAVNDVFASPASSSSAAFLASANSAAFSFAASTSAVSTAAVGLSATAVDRIFVALVRLATRLVKKAAAFNGCQHRQVARNPPCAARTLTLNGYARRRRGKRIPYTPGEQCLSCSLCKLS